MNTRKLAIVSMALAGVLAAASVEARGRDDVQFSVTIGSPGWAVPPVPVLRPGFVAPSYGHGLWPLRALVPRADALGPRRRRRAEPLRPRLQPALGSRRRRRAEPLRPLRQLAPRPRRARLALVVGPRARRRRYGAAARASTARAAICAIAIARCCVTSRLGSVRGARSRPRSDRQAPATARARSSASCRRGRPRAGRGCPPA